jgi:hypothetical protein
MVTNENLGPSTVSDHRKRVRSLIEADVNGGYHPLRKHEKHRAYYALTGEKLEDASNGEVSYRLLELLVEAYDADFELRDPFDASGPFVKAEIAALTDALETEADDA